ncbi:MAG: hypothetical protein OIN66_08810 [Candidatus Methanoperedens sp.]|nr:hypothetical protein [Candidatus Methanoperedens sp.]
MNDDVLKDYSIWNLINKFGIFNILFDFDSVSAYFLTIITAYFYIPRSDFFEIAGALSSSFIGADAALLGIVIAGFAIAVSMFDKKFLLFLDKFGIFEEMIFYFIFTTILLGFGLIASIILSISIPFDHWVSKVLFPFSVLFTIWGILSVLLLLAVFLKDVAILKKDYSQLPDDAI